MTYVWSPSAVERNRRQHSLEGNGGGKKGAPYGKGNYGKGRSSKGKGADPSYMQQPSENQQNDTLQSENAQAEKAIRDRLFAEEVLANLPAHLAAAHQPRLLQSEWGARVCLPHELGPRGGVSLIRKSDLVQVLQQVGQTSRPTAIVTMQPGYELYLKGAHSSEIWCHIQVPGDSGPTVVYVKRFLTQLGMDPANRVSMDTQGLTIIQQATTMQKLALKFDVKGGWDLESINGIIVSDLLRSLISETAFDQVNVRVDGSATVLVHRTCVEKLLRHSGQSYVFIKPHIAEAEWRNLELLWPPNTIAHTEALQLCTEYNDALGLARKLGGEDVRYGLRFQDPEKMKACAAKLKLAHVVDLGRFKITSIMTGTGSADVFSMMGAIGWVLDSVEYIGEGHAIVAAKTCPAQNKYCLQRSDGAPVPMWIHAVNAKARALFKAQNIQSRQVDGEGDEVEDAPMERISLDS